MELGNKQIQYKICGLTDFGRLPIYVLCPRHFFINGSKTLAMCELKYSEHFCPKKLGFLGFARQSSGLECTVHFCFPYSCPFMLCINPFSLKFPILLHSKMIYLHYLMYLSWDFLRTRRTVINFSGFGRPNVTRFPDRERTDRAGRVAGWINLFFSFILSPSYVYCNDHLYA